ncbi:MAG: hypothetical protein O3A01_07600 [bacterium]|nr:hypothetical protein [bacterium]
MASTLRLVAQQWKPVCDGLRHNLRRALGNARITAPSPGVIKPHSPDPRNALVIGDVPRISYEEHSVFRRLQLPPKLFDGVLIPFVPPRQDESRHGYLKRAIGGVQMTFDAWEQSLNGPQVDGGLGDSLNAHSMALLFYPVRKAVCPVRNPELTPLFVGELDGEPYYFATHILTKHLSERHARMAFMGPLIGSFAGVGQGYATTQVKGDLSIRRMYSGVDMTLLENCLQLLFSTTMLEQAAAGENLIDLLITHFHAEYQSDLACASDEEDEEAAQHRYENWLFVMEKISTISDGDWASCYFMNSLYLNDEFGNPGNYIAVDPRSVISNTTGVVSIDCEKSLPTAESFAQTNPAYVFGNHITGSPAWRQKAYSDGLDASCYLPENYPYGMGVLDAPTFGSLASLFFPPPNSPVPTELVAILLRHNGDISKAANTRVPQSFLDELLVGETPILQAIRTSEGFAPDTPLAALTPKQMSDVARFYATHRTDHLTIGDLALARFKGATSVNGNVTMQPDFTQLPVPHSAENILL